MKLKALVGALAVSLALPSQAAINGWFDVVDVQMIDTAYGWICDSSNPYTAPGGSLVVYKNGAYNSEFSVSSFWGGYRPDVSGAGYCGGNAYTGWTISGWFASTGQAIDVYYRHPDNTMQLLGGSGKICNGQGLCY